MFATATDGFAPTTFSRLPRTSVALGLILALLAATINSAAAATITVTTTEDNTLAGDGECTLREALANAESGEGVETSSGDCAPGGIDDEIVFLPGLAGGTITLNGSELSVETRYVLPYQSLTITGPVSGDPSGLTLDANHQSRILRMEGPLFSRTFTIRNLTFVGGRAPGSGGAILATGSSLEITHAVFRDNRTISTVGGGGAIFSRDARIENTRIVGNGTAGEHADGGGISAGALEMVGSLVANNWTEGDDAAGGGISAGGAELHDSTVTGNRTAGENSPGGGIAGYGGINLFDSEVGNNRTGGQDSGGGGIWSGGSVYASGAAIHNNFTGGDGSDGGGIYVYGESSFSPFFFAGDLTLINSTVSGNETRGIGSRGAAMIFSVAEAGSQVISGGDFMSLHTTISGNPSPNGGSAIHARSTDIEVSIQNSIITGRMGSLCNRIADSISASLLTDTTCGRTATPIADIGLGDLADNGGPTPTHALSADSVALDAAGDCVADHGITTDQRGAPRPAGTACDIGAVEGTGPLAMPAGNRVAWLALAGLILIPTWLRQRVSVTNLFAR